MVDTTRTTTVLLDGLHDPDNAGIWTEFDRRYRPILIGFARHLGLSEPDAADVAQETMTQFIQEYRAGKYDRTRGRLHSWLIGLAKYRVAMLRRKTQGRREVRGDSAIMDLSDRHRLTQIWEDERRQVILRKAMSELRTATKLNETTIRAFELLVVNQLPVNAVAEELGIGAQEVYLAKSRVAARLRDILQRLESAYEDAP